MKTCSHCGLEKPLTEFYKNKRRCKPCYKELQNVHHHSLAVAERALRLEKQLAYQKTPAGRDAARRARLKFRYNLSVEEYDAMLAAQDGHCYFCPTVDPKPHKHFTVDHDHVTGKVRGLLCLPCNTKLGFVEQYGLTMIAEYLARGE